MEIYSANKDRSVRSWAPELDENAREQALRSARSPAVAGDIALMPDAHFGMGATVGSVIPTESAIIPAAVGVDIGCGMIATELDLEASALPIASIRCCTAPVGRFRLDSIATRTQPRRRRVG